ELLRERSVVRPAPDRRHPEAEPARELDAEVAEAADAEHRHQVAGLRAAVPQRVVGRDAGAKKGCRLSGAQAPGYGGQRLHGSDHVFLIAAVVADARDLEVAAVAEVPPPALWTGVVMAAMPTDSNTLPRAPAGDTCPQRIDHARHLVSRHARIADTGPVAFLGQHVAVADPAGLHPDAHVSCPGLGNLPLDDLKVGSCRGNLHYLHRCRGLGRCHDRLPPPMRLGESADPTPAGGGSCLQLERHGTTAPSGSLPAALPGTVKAGGHSMARYGKKAQSKVKRAMHERKKGTLRSGRSGRKVKSRKQAIAIGLSEARRAGAKVPRKKTARRRK